MWIRRSASGKSRRCAKAFTVKGKERAADRRGVPGGFGIRLLLVCIGVVVISFGVSMYQTADAGVAPWDSLSLILTKRVPKISYFWHRIFTDVLAVIVSMIAGGVVGIGTAVCALGLGPVVHFFNRTVSEKLVEKKA